MQSSNKNLISVAARSSPLAKAQVEEVLKELQSHHPHIDFEITHIETIGDKDQTTSLRTLDKTDFFTKEIDGAILYRICRIAIHSAKDLPFPVPQGLSVICMTKGLDSSDSLVMRPGDTLKDLPVGARIATSSARREETVKLLRSDLTFIDLRGTIGQRLQKLELFEADGVVIAEAALIRLGLTHLNRIRLPGTTVEGQGRLAVVAKDDDNEMRTLFSRMHHEK